MWELVQELLAREAAPWWASGVSALIGFLVGWVPSYLTARANDRRAFSLEMQRTNMRAVEEACSDFLLACEKATTFAHSIPQFSTYSKEEREASPLLTSEQEAERQRIFEMVNDKFFRVVLIAPPDLQGQAQSYFWEVLKMLNSASDKEIKHSDWSNMGLNIQRGGFLEMVRSACGIDQLPVYKKQTRANRRAARRLAKYRRQEEAQRRSTQSNEMRR